jgi:mRNA-degrading endonuclease YafQ of YafQ-DinJ toxin-antitoxin module
MSHQLLRTNTFIHAAKKFLRKRPDLQENLSNALELLSENPYHPYLRTHKLTGDLAGSLACSAGFDLRIVFSFVKHGGKQAILLETVGTHEEVY